MYYLHGKTVPNPYIDLLAVSGKIRALLLTFLPSSILLLHSKQREIRNNKSPDCLVFLDYKCETLYQPCKKTDSEV